MNYQKLDLNVLENKTNKQASKYSLIENHRKVEKEHIIYDLLDAFICLVKLPMIRSKC